MNLDFAAAVFADLPRKQSQRNHRFVVKRTFTADDLELLMDRKIADKSIAKISRAAFDDMAKRLAHALCNAGPHVVNLTVGIAVDAEEETASVVVETPIIPTATYGAAVHVDELRPRDGTYKADGTPWVAPEQSPPSRWSRFKSLVKQLGEPLPYDGPRGWRDAA